MSLYLAIELNDMIKKELALKQLIMKQSGVIAEYEDPTRFHITLRFLSEKEQDNEQAINALKLFESTYTQLQFNVLAKNFGKFPQGAAWVGVNQCLSLYNIKYQIEDCLIKSNFPLKADTHKGYIPHITMGYDVKDEIGDLNFGDGISIIVDNISLWAGFKANGTYIHNKLYGIDFKNK